MNRNTKLLVAASLAATSTVATAVGNCASAVSSYNSCSTDTCRASYLSNYPDCFASSNSSSSSTQISATTIQQVATISNAVSGRLLSLGLSGPSQKTAAAGGGATGLAASNGGEKFNVWGNVSESDSAYRGDALRNNADKVSNRVTNVVLGLDYRFAPNMVVGFSYADDRGRGSSGGVSVSTSTSGQTYAPYFGWQISKELALDLSAGWGDGTSNIGGTTAKNTRDFYAANLTYATWMGNWQVLGKAGYLDATQKTGNSNSGGVVNNDSGKASIGQIRLGAEAGYWMNGVMPFVGLAYTDDSRSVSSATGIADTSKLGKDAFVFSAGINFFSLAKGVTGGIVATTETNRSNGKNDTIGANISFRF